MRAAVTPVRENYFVLQIEREQMIDAGRVEFPADDAFLGGTSGAPVIAMNDLSYPSVGIVSQSPDNLALVYVSPLNHQPRSFDQLPDATAGLSDARVKTTKRPPRGELCRYESTMTGRVSSPRPMVKGANDHWTFSIAEHGFGCTGHV